MGLFVTVVAIACGSDPRSAAQSNTPTSISSDTSATATTTAESMPTSESSQPSQAFPYVSESWADVWLCADEPVESVDLTANTTLTCSVSVEVVGNSLLITTTGIPNHDFESTIGCCVTEQNSVWTIPLAPELSTGDPSTAPDRGPIAFTVSGVAIYGPEEGPGGDAVALEYGYFVEDRQPVDLGVCGGHGGPGGQYHYHYDSNCMHWHEANEDILDYVTGFASTVISKVIGFAFDGFPIYSTYESDSSGAVAEVTSSYRLLDNATGYGGIDDYVYVEDLGVLDECNGHFGSTPEEPEGIYHYHTTLTNGEGGLGFPYFLLCYKGTVNEDNFNTAALGGPPGGGPPNRGRRG
jgi:hypothetical protein